MTLVALSQDLEQISLEADRRFRRIVASLAIPTLAFCVFTFFFKLTTEVLTAKTPQQERFARLLQELEQKPLPPPPKPVEEKPVAPETAKPEAAPKKQAKPEKQEAAAPSPEQQMARARAKASRAGVMAFADQLADLRQSAASGIDPNQRLQSGIVTTNTGAGNEGGGNPGLIASTAGRGSGGIGEGGVGPVTNTANGPGLGGHGTSRVTSSIGGNGSAVIGPKHGSTGRTVDQIQIVFDRNMGSFYAIYLRALRDNPNLRGKLVINLTIAPDGSVTQCHVVSSELGDRELESKVVARVQLINFGAKPVPPVTLDYPIALIPP